MATTTTTTAYSNFVHSAHGTPHTVTVDVYIKIFSIFEILAKRNKNTIQIQTQTGKVEWYANNDKKYRKSKEEKKIKKPQSVHH